VQAGWAGSRGRRPARRHRLLLPGRPRTEEFADALVRTLLRGIR
jgi:hypothetical protein